MSYDLFLKGYTKGAVKNYDNFQGVVGRVESTGNGIMLSGRSIVANWFHDNLESVQIYNEQNDRPKWSGADENILYLVKKTEYFSLLNECRELVSKKEETDKAVDEAVGDSTLYGRSELGMPKMYEATQEIMKLLPEQWRADRVFDWNIPRLRDYWWVYWDDINKALTELERMEKEIDWDKEDVFLLIS